MKKNYSLFLIVTFVLCYYLPNAYSLNGSYCYKYFDSTKVTLSEKIINERNNELLELRKQLASNEAALKQLIESNRLVTNSESKIRFLEEYQLTLTNEITFLKKVPTTKALKNGQLAFIELLAIQRDIKPLELFSETRLLSEKLSSLNDISQYSEFKQWVDIFNNDQVQRNRSIPLVQIVQNSLSLLSETTKSLPIYGSLLQSLSNGVSNLLASKIITNRNQTELSVKLNQLLVVSAQFNSQKQILDNEWNMIDRELSILGGEFKTVLYSQMKFYKIDTLHYKEYFVNETSETKRDKFKLGTQASITATIKEIESKNQFVWVGNVEKHMYQVQSLRLRFGHLTLRMLETLNKYQILVQMYNNDKVYPETFVKNVKDLQDSITRVKDKFQINFLPQKYIEDSATMFIESNVVID